MVIYSCFVHNRVKDRFVIGLKITICARTMCVIFRRRDPENLRLEVSIGLFVQNVFDEYEHSHDPVAQNLYMNSMAK